MVKTFMGSVISENNVGSKFILNDAMQINKKEEERREKSCVKWTGTFKTGQKCVH